MKQQHILQLLREAAVPGCGPSRQERILELLIASAGHNDPSGLTKDVVWHLFYQTIGNRPDLLVNQFPAFAVLCGDTNQLGHIARIVEWDLLAPTLPTLVSA